LLVAVLVGTPAFVADAQISPDVLEGAILKTVLLVILNANQEAFGTCSGAFVLSSGLILSAAHCVRADEDDAKHANGWQRPVPDEAARAKGRDVSRGDPGPRIPARFGIG
jgi:hypothetical protein